MQIWGNASSPSQLGRGLTIRAPGAQAKGGTASAATGPSLRDFASDVRELGDALNALRVGGRFRTSGSQFDAIVYSASDLGLGDDPTSATLSSTEEVNATPTSYSTTAPAWQGASSADPTVGGTYDGSQGDTTLTFTATLGGIVDVSPIQIEVTDGSGGTVDTFTIGIGQGSSTFTLSNGLELEFDSGTISTGDAFELDVFASVGAAVDPDVAFEDGPGFEEGTSVVEGSFFVNGQRINVAESDTIQTILDAITASDAGVDAEFDAATETVLLTQQTPGSTETIELDADTSGFLAAVKLDGAVVEAGTDDESEALLQDVSALSGIGDGTFSINGIEFTVDRSTESLASLIRTINASDAGVHIHHFSSTGLVRIRADGTTAFELDDGTSGFFSGLDIQEGLYRGEDGRRGVQFNDRDALQDAMRRFSDAFERVAGAEGGFGAPSAVQRTLTRQLEGAFSAHLGLRGRNELDSGLGIDLGERSGGVRGVELDLVELGRAGKRNSRDLADLLFGDRDEEGLVDRLEGALEDAYRSLAARLDAEEAAGLRLDVTG